MRQIQAVCWSWLAAAAVLTVVGCGGGGGGDGGGDATPPTVTAISPVNGASGVAATTLVRAAFSEPVNAATVTAATFTLTSGGVPVPAAVTASSTSALLTPAAGLGLDTLYTVTVTTGVKDLAGNPLAANFTASFTTEILPWPGTRQLGSAADDEANGVATDGAGNVYVAGSTLGDLDGNTSLGTTDGFLVKYNAFGVKQWTRQFGTAAVDEVFAVATDGAGNVYAAGSTLGDLDGLSAGNSDLFLVRYDASGGQQWARQLGTAAVDVANAVAADTAGNIYVAGSTVGGLDGNVSAGNTDLFLVKYDPSGLKQWTRQLGTAAVDEAYAVATDAAGSIYVAGSTVGDLDGNVSAGNTDLFLVKYAASGDKLWTRQLGSAAVDEAYGVATDGAGSIYVAGGTVGSLDGNVSAGGTDLFLVKYDASGGKQWTRQAGSAAEDWANGVAAIGAALGGNVFAAGTTYDGFDGNATAGGADLFLVKYDPFGTRQ